MYRGGSKSGAGTPQKWKSTNIYFTGTNIIIDSSNRLYILPVCNKRDVYKRQVLIVIIGIIRRDSRCGILFIVPFALVVCNNFISGAYGFLNDIFFITILTLLCSCLLYTSRCV